MKAELVYDGGEVTIPAAMGQARTDQMQGTVREQLIELAGRCCYDSLGQGRGSAEYHKHILDVGHTSVLEHATISVAFDAGLDVRVCLNRKGVWVGIEDNTVLITLNFRALLEWERYTTRVNRSTCAGSVSDTLWYWGWELAPQIFARESTVGMRSKLVGADELNDDQAHISLWMTGSRGWSHEMVRHRYAMSQRSTRYVDESDGEWVLHPEIKEFLDETDDQELTGALEDVVFAGKRAYEVLVAAMTPWARSRGLDKTAARKLARGAARGYLGNALRTEMIFTASVSGWKDMIRQRLNPAADAEIRSIFKDVVVALRGSRYGDRFNDISASD